MPIYTGITALVSSTALFFVLGLPIISPVNLFIMLAAGILIAWATVAYFKALSVEEGSVVNMLFQMSALITLLLSFLFLKETISFKQTIGFFIVLSSTLLVSLKNEKKRFSISSVFFLMILFDTLLASSSILIKTALNSDSFWHLLPYESLGIFIGGFMIYLTLSKTRIAFHKNLKTVTSRTIGIIFLNEGLFLLGKSCTYFAFSLGPIALVNVLDNTQAFYAIILGIVLTLLFPSIFKEKIDRKNLTRKVVAALLLFLGIILLV